MVEWLHPGLLLVAGALLLRLVPAGGRRWFLVFLGAAAVADCLAMTPGTWGVVRFLELDLTFGRVDRLSLVFDWVFSVMALIGIIYSLHQEEPGRQQAALVYADSALGTVFAGVLAVLFLFWELMAFSSVFLIWQRRRPASLAAGSRGAWSGCTITIAVGSTASAGSCWALRSCRGSRDGERTGRRLDRARKIVFLVLRQLDQVSLEFVGRQRLAEEEPLDLVAPETSQ